MIEFHFIFTSFFWDVILGISYSSLSGKDVSIEHRTLIHSAQKPGQALGKAQFSHAAIDVKGVQIMFLL